MRPSPCTRRRALPWALCLAAVGASACTPPPVAVVDCPVFADAADSGVADDAFVDVEAVDVDVDGLAPFVRDLVFWMLDRRDDGAAQIAAVDAATGPYATAVFAAFAGGVVDEDVLTAGLARFYGCARDVPPTLAALEASGVEFDVVDEEVNSAVKGAVRRIYRSSIAGAFVSQTVIAGAVTETEVLLTDRRRDGSFDIVTYGADGARTAQSDFVAPCAARAALSACVASDPDRAPGAETITAPAPLSCLRCHHSENGGFFDVTPAP